MAGAKLSRALSCGVVSGGLILLVLTVIWQLTAFPSYQQVAEPFELTHPPPGF